MNSIINKTTKKSNNVGTVSSFKLSRKKTTTYKLPYPGQVPAGDYISRVVSAKETVTKSGNAAIEVCYEIKDASVCEKIVNGKLPSNTNIPTHNIRQVYPLGTSFFDNYCEAMSEAAGSDEVMLDDTIGITERVTLDYGTSNIGGYVERHPLTSDKYDKVFRNSKPLKVNLLDDSDDAEDDSKNSAFHKSKKVISPSDNRINNEDDEFDDFLEDDIDE